MSGRDVKAFIDANVIISGLLFQGNESVLLELGRFKALELVTNRYVLEEVTVVLNREEFQLAEEEIRGLLKYLYNCLTVLEDPTTEAIHRNIDLLDDKKDIPVALGALESGADFLVTGDRELLGKSSIPSITTGKLLRQMLYDRE